MATDPFFNNGLSPAEAERLAILAEECAEVIQVVGKILRHGYASFHPANPDMTNRDLLTQEMGHVFAAQDMMVLAGDVEETDIDHSLHEKQRKIKPFLHHQR